VSDCPWEIPLVRSWIQLPHLFPGERTKLEERLRRLEQTEEGVV
jgi:hypothetical protein